MQCSPLRAPKRPNSEPHGAIRQQAIAKKTSAKWSEYQIPSVIVVFVILVLGLICKSSSQNPQEALNLLDTEERYRALFYKPLYTFSHNLQIANKIGLKMKQCRVIIVTKCTALTCCVYVCYVAGHERAKSSVSASTNSDNLDILLSVAVPTST
jgi:hypothetical protein